MLRVIKFLKYSLSISLIMLSFIQPSYTQQSNDNLLGFKNRFRADNYIKYQDEELKGGTLKGHVNSGVWVKEPIDVTHFRLRKAGTTDQYLNTEKGPLECSSVPKGYHTSHWKLIHVSGTNFYRIENRHRKGQFLNVEKGPLEASNVPANYWTSHWEMMGKKDLVKMHPNEPLDPYPSNVKSTQQTLREGVHFYKLINNQWKEVTVPGDLTDMINNPTVPSGAGMDYYEDWYYVYLDASKDYYFNAKTSGFDTRISHSSRFSPTYGRSANWFSPETSSQRAVLLSQYGQENEVFRTGLGTGYQWVVVSSTQRRKTGSYTFTFSDYGDGYDKKDGGFNEMSRVAFSKVGNLNPGATNLYLNFDGCLKSNFPQGKAQLSDKSTVAVTTKDFWPFHASPYLEIESLPGAKDQDAVIQHILFKTAEIYSPFNVIVSKIDGNSTVGLNKTSATVFIGDDIIASKGSYGVQHMTVKDLDFGNKRLDLGWVDNVIGPNQPVQSIDQVIQWIAHEAGHAFGLKHIRANGSDIPLNANGKLQSFSTWASNGFNNPQCLGEWNDQGSMFEVMSYNSTNSIFEDFAFDLTGWNNDKQGLNNNGCGRELSHRGSFFPVWEGTTITKQNSYRYLKYVLGSGRTGETSNVADRTAVMQYDVRNAVYLYSRESDRSAAAKGKHGIYDDKDRALLKEASIEDIRNAIKNNPDIVNNRISLRDDKPYHAINLARYIADNIDRIGDYDVYLFKPKADWLIEGMSCTPNDGENLDPILLLYDETGKKLLAYDDNSGGVRTSLLEYEFEMDKVYKLVVGAKDNSTKGGYNLTIYPFEDLLEIETPEGVPPVQFYVDNNHDQILKTVKDSSLPPLLIKISLSTAPEVGSYKSIKISPSDELAFEIELDGDDHGPRELILPTALFSDSFEIEFIEAKILGFPTGVGNKTFQTSDFEGRETNFLWKNE